MTRRMDHIQQALVRLNAAAARAAEAGRSLKFMEVCGTHTMAAFRSGLHALMPDNVTLLSGPGCPVCVTAQGDIDQMIALAVEHDVILCTYGDMMRVPGADGSLEHARTNGADVRVVYSTMDAVKLAATNVDREVVFAAVGFETTAPATAAAVLAADEQGLANFSVLTSHKRVMPAMLALLQSRTIELDGFLCPGHVSVIIGSEPYRPIVDEHGLPCVIGGFEDMHLTEALAELADLAADERAELVNSYPQAVKPHGNAVAIALLDRMFQPVSMRWRGLVEIPDSGLRLRDAYAAYDAARKFNLSMPEDAEPRGCLCGQVITGQVTPPDCKLFGTACTPIRPIGPCMVSGEGTCQAWFKYNRPGTSFSGRSKIGANATTLLEVSV